MLAHLVSEDTIDFAQQLVHVRLKPVIDNLFDFTSSCASKTRSYILSISD